MLFKASWAYALLLPLISLEALPGFSEPWGQDSDLLHRQQIQGHQSVSPLVQLASFVIRFHQTVISPADGPRSHFKPSSSQYMFDALHKHGFFAGFCMGCDRLLRENGSDWVYRKTDVNGTLFNYDPVP